MTRNIYPTYSNSMFEHKFITFGKDECLYVKEDVEQEELDYMFYCAKKKHKCVCFIKTNITCPRCGKKLHFNGKSPRKWNKKTTIKLQNYIHRDCNISKKASLNKFRDKHCCYTRMIREGATQSALISYRSYQSKKEELNSYYKTQISTSTIYYTEMTSFWKYYRELVKKTEARNRKTRNKNIRILFV